MLVLGLMILIYLLMFVNGDFLVLFGWIFDVIGKCRGNLDLGIVVVVLFF